MTNFRLISTISDLPKGITYEGKIYRSLSKNAVENYGIVPNKINDFSIDNAWGSYDLLDEGFKTLASLNKIKAIQNTSERSTKLTKLINELNITDANRYVMTDKQLEEPIEKKRHQTRNNCFE